MAICEEYLEQLKQAKTLAEVKKMAEDFGIRLSDEELEQVCGGINATTELKTRVNGAIF